MGEEKAEQRCNVVMGTFAVLENAKLKPLHSLEELFEAREVLDLERDGGKAQVLDLELDLYQMEGE